MKSYTITAAAIEHYADALAQFEHLLGRLTHEETQRVTHGELEAMVQAVGLWINGGVLNLCIWGNINNEVLISPHCYLLKLFDYKQSIKK
jgi:hypothetical protein